MIFFIILEVYEYMILLNIFYFELIEFESLKLYLM